MSDPTETQQIAWNGLLKASAQARASAEEALQGAGLPSLEIYDVLAQLDRDAVGEGLTATQLQGALRLPQYAVSRLVDRVEGLGLLARQPHPDDKRSSLLRITPKGREIRAAAWQHYSASIKAFFDARLRPGQVERLADLLGMMDGG